MISIEYTDVYGFEAAIRGMRNPMNSWEKSDSWHGCRAGDYGHIDSYDCEERCRCDCEFCIGENDMKLMKQLVRAGSDHSKFMRYIIVTCDITAPMYWWKEFDTYKVGTVRNSCSTMHKIHAKKFTIDDFSHEHLVDDVKEFFEKEIIDALNQFRDVYVNFEEYERQGKLREGATKKDVWWQMIQLLPSNYNQRATVQMNYAVLRNMYHARKEHKLDEWREFCKWVESLPYSELITEV